jgi:hypothetical protein
MRRFLFGGLFTLAALMFFSGCGKGDPATGSTVTESTLSEADVRALAESAAERVVERMQLEERNRRIQSAQEDARRAREATAEAEKESAADAVHRSEEAYWQLVPSERARVDAIRERIASAGLPRLDHEDVRWAWQGDGQGCLRADLLAAAEQALPHVEADTALLTLSKSELIEFYCLEPLEQLRRLQLAKPFHEGDPNIAEDVIIEFRNDPFLAKLVREYMKARYQASLKARENAAN